MWFQWTINLDVISKNSKLRYVILILKEVFFFFLFHVGPLWDPLCSATPECVYPSPTPVSVHLHPPCQTPDRQPALQASHVQHPGGCRVTWLRRILWHYPVWRHHAQWVHAERHWLCSHGLESRSERCFGSRSKTWLGSWFELRAFTCIASAFPITIRICALGGNYFAPTAQSVRADWPMCLCMASARIYKMHTHE